MAPAVTEAQVKKFAQIFVGLDSTYGIYNVVPDKNKVKQEGNRRTVTDQVTEGLYELHLNGKQGLGICPITADNTCMWCCLDVDVYDMAHMSLQNLLNTHSLPFVMCRTKSGGAHLYIFFTSPVSARIVREKLMQLSASLGYAGCEIFPKQPEILVTRGDGGNWLNLPYFHADRTNRYAYNRQGDALDLDQFFEYVQENALDEERFLNLEIGITVSDGTAPAESSAAAKKRSEFDDAPPCIKSLLLAGVPDGCRNICAYHLAVFAKKKYPDNREWEDVIEKYTNKYFDPPLTSREVIGVVKSVDKKDYRYKCKEHPMVDYCNAAVCRTKKYGIDSSIEVLNLSSLTKLDSEPPIWFINVEEARVELTTDDLINQKKFQQKCMDQVNYMPPRLKENDWQQVIHGLLENVNIIKQPDDLSTRHLFFAYVEEFCTGRLFARTEEEVLQNKPYTFEGRTYFQMIALYNFLERKKFNTYTHPQVGIRLKDIGGRPDRMRVRNKQLRVWSIPAYETELEPYKLPPMGNEEVF